MTVQITSSLLHGDIPAITSKSHAHRAIIAAALCDEQSKTEIILNSISKDIEATVSCITEIGGTAEIKEDRIIIRGIKRKDKDTNISLNCCESGSTARFLLPVAAALYDNFTMMGAGRLPERPFEILCDAMKKNGVDFTSECLPLSVTGNMKSGKFVIAGNVSSQYISGLLFALPILEGDSEIVLTTTVESIGYIKMTIDTLKQFGIRIEAIETGFFIPGNQHYISPGIIQIEGDWSNSAVWLAAGALNKKTKISGNINVSGLNVSSLQGDKEILNILSLFGANIDISDDICSASGNREMKGIEIDAANIPDLVPVIAVVAAGARGVTYIKNAARLRIKESDRLSTVATCLRCLGGNVDELPDGLVINGIGRLKGGFVDSFNDHRIVMCMVLAALISDNPVTITNSEAIKKSYPNFFEDFQKLSGEVNFI